MQATQSLRAVCEVLFEEASRPLLHALRKARSQNIRLSHCSLSFGDDAPLRSDRCFTSNATDSTGGAQAILQTHLLTARNANAASASHLEVLLLPPESVHTGIIGLVSSMQDSLCMDAAHCSGLPFTVMPMQPCRQATRKNPFVQHVQERLCTLLRE